MLGIVAFVVCALAARASPVPRPPPPYSPLEPVPLGPGFVRGVCYPSPSAPATEYGTPGCRDMLKAIRATGATAVSLCPHYLVRRKRPFPLGAYPGAADRDALKQTILWAREEGLEVHLRPQVLTHWDVPRFHLRIEHRDDWKWFFGTLDTLLRDLGELGRETGVRVLSIGTRLEEASRVTPANWRTLIARVREVFPGIVTYDAGWRYEMDDVPFWDALDVISVTLYKRLGDADEDDDRPRRGELLRKADKPTDALADLFYRFGKPVWISEVGFPSNAIAARHAYQRPLSPHPPDPELQARLTAATLLTYQDRRWLGGIMVWGMTGPGGLADTGYSPAGKPVWDELKRWFAPGPARSTTYYDDKDLVPWVNDWF